MEKRITPFFEVGGKRYEIRRTNYVTAEFDRRKSEITMSADDEVEYVKEQDRNKRLEKLSARRDELEAKYLETFDEKDEELYKKSCVAYDNLVAEISQTGNVIGAYHKKILDLGEQLIIASLQWNESGETIRTWDEAEKIWKAYVEEVGNNASVEFVAYTTQYLVSGDEEQENPFVVQQRAKAEQSLQRKQGLNKIK